MTLSVPHDVSVRARYVFSLNGTVLTRPLENVILRLHDGGAVVDPASQHPDIDLGNVAIVPGWVNAHTHLEFSQLAAPFPRQTGDTFVNWITRVLQWRHQRDADDPLAHASSVENGLKESAECGVQLLGEIATENAWPAGYQEQNGQPSRTSTFHRPRGVRFLELIGLGTARVEILIDAAQRYLSNSAPPNWRTGLSPHAPYTVAWEVVEAAAELAHRYQAPVAMHLAETVEELEFLNARRGPLQELLDHRGLWDPTAVPRGIQPIDYLKALSKSPRALIIHGNYLGPLDWRFLATRADTMSVVYCPRTFHYFGHRDYPLEKMLAAGVHVAIGTDSRASNPDLNLLAELKFMRWQHPGLSARQLLELGTEQGAFALGWKPPALRAIDLPDEEVADPFTLLFDF